MARKKVKKKIMKRKIMKKKVEPEEEFAEEVLIRCANCGREIKIVKKEGYSTEGMLCQQCSMGEIIRDG